MIDPITAMLRRSVNPSDYGAYGFLNQPTQSSVRTPQFKNLQTNFVKAPTASGAGPRNWPTVNAGIAPLQNRSGAPWVGDYNFPLLNATGNSLGAAGDRAMKGAWKGLTGKNKGFGVMPLLRLASQMTNNGNNMQTGQFPAPPQPQTPPIP